MSDITTEELLAEIERLETDHAEGATVTELVDQTGRSRRAVLGRLRELAKAGRLVVGHRWITSLSGRPTLVPCYRILKRKRGPR